MERIRHIATLRVPSGRPVVADPMDRDGPRELTARVPPGGYPLQAAVLVGEGDSYGRRFPVTEEPVARLLITAEPAVTWEMGLGGEDGPGCCRTVTPTASAPTGTGTWPVRPGRSPPANWSPSRWSRRG
ncbi:DUF4241 domain-containing protein [Streptomyces sp. NPDC002580]|uniref:DUF4241 domain-containing protein n=1 Tax=Streptomyces sp. NPDC002580 TaxID=3364653 RepID=UPI0036A40826